MVKFSEKVEKGMVLLQERGSDSHNKAWDLVMKISQQHFQETYQGLGVYFAEQGHTSYIRMITHVLDLLDGQAMLLGGDKADARIMIDQKPMLLRRNDGSCGHLAVNLTTLLHRLKEVKADWIIHVDVDLNEPHFNKCFQIAKRARWLPPDEKSTPRANFMGLQMVAKTLPADCHGVNGLLRHIMLQFEAELCKKGVSANFAPALGYGGLSYSILRHNRDKSRMYTFEIADILNLEIDSAYRLVAVYVVVCDCMKKSVRLIKDLNQNFKVALEQPEARDLAVHIQKFPKEIKRACVGLSPHILCDFT